jgi:PAS domain S-box-containing protein
MDKEILIILSVGLFVMVAVLALIIQRLHKKGGSAKKVSVLASSLRDEKLRSSIMLEAIEDGVMLIDDQQVIQLFNPGAANITGWTAEEARGLAWQSVLKFIDKKGEPLADADNPLVRMFTKGETVRDNDANIQTKSGKSIALSLVFTPLHDDQKNITGAVGIFRDVSEERQAEQQRAEFISTASHEMRTPVAAIEGYLALALNDKVSTIDSRARDYLEKAHASTQHLGKLFQDLLTSAKAEDGRLTSHPTVVEIGNWLENLASDLKFSAEKKGLYTEFNFGGGSTIDARQVEGMPSMTGKTVRPLYYTQVDPDRLREVVTNLFDNAVKYTEQGKVSLGLTGNDQVVQIFVRDTGPGIPREDIGHLFQKFYRVDNSATRTIGGTGLGLFICRKIIELYGGRIWVESEVGQGSTFFINLPRLTTQKAEQMRAAEARNPAASSVMPLVSPKV